ncbi:MAG: hypothetical protein ABEJ59_03740 [Halanaeroarchaeum sp.]
MERSRGQVVLVAALGIAVTFVALALVTNTVIYTQNLATRETVDGVDPVAFQQSTADATADLLALANTYNASGDIDARFRADVADYSNASAIEVARNGHVATASVRSTTPGTRIYQDHPRNFTNGSAVTDWTVATDVTATRRFELNVTRENLSDGTPFTVIATDGTDTWTATIGGNATNVTLTVDDGTPTTCTVAAETTTVDLTRPALNGTTCDAPAFATGVGTPYDVQFSNGAQGYGRYVLFVDDGATVDGTNYASTLPDTAPALYDATVHVHVRRPDLDYATNVTVAPEDHPEGESYGPA